MEKILELGPGGQLLIPKELLAAAGLKPGQKIRVYPRREPGLILVPAEPSA